MCDRDTRSSVVRLSESFLREHRVKSQTQPPRRPRIEKSNTSCLAPTPPGNIVSYDGATFKILATGMRGADAVEFGEGVIYVSSWPLGKVWKFDRKTKETTVLSESFTTAADFFFDRKNNQLIVPDMLEGTLTFLPLE